MVFLHLIRARRLRMSVQPYATVSSVPLASVSNALNWQIQCSEMLVCNVTLSISHQWES